MARWLKYRGARVDVIPVISQPKSLRGFDLVVDAAFGVGCSRSYDAPSVSPSSMVLAVDVPSGVDADTGALLGHPMRADVTAAIGAFKMAHINGEAKELAGDVRFLDLGIVNDFSDGVIEDVDLAQFVTANHDDHKWKHAIGVFAGSPMMPGAAQLVTRGAMCAGASMIVLESNGEYPSGTQLPVEVIRGTGLHHEKRLRAIVAGPGLGRDCTEWLTARLRGVNVPVVLDADALVPELTELAPADPLWVLTPHDGEFARLSGTTLTSDRVGPVRQLSRDTGAVVLLKGPTTLIANPDGNLRVVNSGTAALATAGSGDVLSGMIGATLARGFGSFEAASLAAHVHGRAGARLPIYTGASGIPFAVTSFLEALK